MTTNQKKTRPVEAEETLFTEDMLAGLEAPSAEGGSTSGKYSEPVPARSRARKAPKAAKTTKTAEVAPAEKPVKSTEKSLEKKPAKARATKKAAKAVTTAKIEETPKAEEAPKAPALPQLVLGKPLTVGEMFSGPGGIGIALNRAHSEALSFKHLWATDWDADTCETYRRNVLKDTPEATSICEDVRKLDIDGLPVVDGFLYGFPCNDFSLVGESKGLHGNYGGLFSYGVKYIERANPLFFFAENVSGLSSANDGKAFKVILNALNHAGKFGYTITAHLYKFEEYGVPQARHRYILIGIRGDLGKPFRVPKPDGRIRTCAEALENIPLSAANQETTRQTQTVVDRLALIPEGWNVWQAEEAGLLPEHLKLNVKGARLSQIYRRLDSKKPAYTITGSGGGGTHVYHWSENRALTNRERARLQTFPDDFVFSGSKESVRKQIGMAVPCDGAQVILEALLKTLEGADYASVEASAGVYPANTFDAPEGH